jgi:Ca-activated chloride channel homolog
LKKLAAIFCSFFLFAAAEAQYYLRGEIKDEQNNPLPNVKILLHSNEYIYYSGSSGGFGITIPSVWDSVTISADGYYTYSSRLNSGKYQYITLKMRFAPMPKPSNRLMSFTKNLTAENWNRWTVGAETYSSLIENEFVPALKFPVTGFALNINKASYSNIRRFLNMGAVVPPDAVRIEEMLNYFNFDYMAPQGDSSFSFGSTLSSCPWNPATQLLFLHICARKANIDSIPPANLVFLIDVSGSMDLPNRLPLLKSAFSLMVNNLRAVDTISIVVYGGVTGVWLTPTAGNERKKILESIEQLEPGGATPGEAGIRAAYRLAQSTFIKNGNNRVILATDGDFNVGQKSDEELDQLINGYRMSNIYLTCLGVGMGNYKDSKLEILAKRGNGNFAYLDNEKEAEKVLMEEFTQTIYAVARDAYLDVSFNPLLVKDYRLIGFDNKLNALTDSSNTIEGGEVGSGHSLMAMFEIRPAAADSVSQGNRMADIRLHYRTPRDSVNETMCYAVAPSYKNFYALPPSYRFAGSVALFGGLLKNSPFTEKSNWQEVMKIAEESYDLNNASQKEYLGMVEKAKKIYQKEKKKKRPVIEEN